MTTEIPELEELLARLPNIELFSIFMKPTDQFQSPLSEAGRPLLVAHLTYLFELQDQQLLLGSGPLDLDVDRIEGMCIVRADSREHAESLAAEEPYAKAGWRVNTVRSWQLNEGLFVATAQQLITER